MKKQYANLLIAVFCVLVMPLSTIANVTKGMCNALNITLQTKEGHTCNLWMSAIDGIVTKDNIDAISTLTDQAKTLTLGPDYTASLSGEKNPLRAELLYMCDGHQDPIIIESTQQGIRKNVFSTPKPGKIAGKANTPNTTFTSQMGICKTSGSRAGTIDWTIDY